MIITHSPEETRALGKKIAAQLKAGDTVLLTGDMGAGKSELARGIARGLGVAGPVPSPSFTILNAYDEGRIPLYHFDWYRVQDSAEIGEMGMDEQIGGDGIALIEWSENAPEFVPEKALRILIERKEDDSRAFSFIPLGGFEFEEETLA